MLLIHRTLEDRGYCLPSQDIRTYVEEDRIKAVFSEDRIQTNSLDLTLSDTCYWIADKLATQLRANVNIPVEKAIKDLDYSKKKKFDISDGLVLKKGHNYLIPLNESIRLEDDEYAVMSPKSSIGRTFTDVRGFAEGNPCSDIIHPRFMDGSHKRIWILVSPLKFDVKVEENLSMNQLRIFKGVGAKTNRRELENKCDDSPVVLNEDGERYDNPFFTEDGLIVHLSLESWDGSNKKENLIVEPKEAYILFTDEVVNVPKDLSGELKPYSLTNVRGPLHFAGFFDNGFRGSGVLEFISEERGKVALNDQTPIAEFDFYKTRDVPDKIYGDEKSGSNYQGQKGPKMAKFFEPIDTKGLVALKAKKTPLTLDLTSKHNHDIRNFFQLI